MVNILKKFFRFLVLVIVLAGLLMAAATLLIPTDKISEKVIEELQNATGAEVALGSSSLKFFPTLGIRVSDSQIKGTGVALAEATGSANTLENFVIDLENFDVRLAIKPLLKKNIVVEAVTLVGANFHVESDKGDLIVRNYSLKIKKLSLPMLALQEAKQSPGLNGPNTKEPVGEIIPEDLNFGLEFQASEISYQRSILENVFVMGHMQSKVLSFDSIKANKADGLITGEMIVDWFEDPWGNLAFRMDVESVPSGALFSPWIEGMQQRLDCTLDGGVAGGCNLKDEETILNSLDLVGSLHSGEGVLYAQDLLQDVSQYLGKRQDLKDIQFHALTHNFSVEKGRYLVQDLEIDGLDTDWTCQGWIALKGTMNLGIKVKLPVGFTPDLGKWSFLAESLRDSEGRVPLAFKLQGKTTRPKVIMDLSMFNQLQQEAEVTAQQAVESAAKKGLSEILDKWKTR